MILAVLLLVVLGGVGPAQEREVAALRARAEAGEREAVLADLEARSTGGKLPYELLELGAELALEIPDFPRAFAFVSRMKTLGKGDPRVDEWLGHVTFRQAAQARALRSATYEDAAAHYADARRHGGDPYRNAYWEAESWLGAGRVERALKSVEEALAARPGDPAATRMAADLMLRLGRAPAAGERLLPVWEKHRRDPELALLLLKARLAEGDRPRLRETFLTLVQIQPKHVELYRALCDGLKASGRPADLEALRGMLEEARRRMPDEPLPLLYLGFTSALEGRLEEALAFYEQYRDRRPREGKSHLWVGSLQVSLGRLDEARASLLRAGSLGGVPQEELAAEVRRLVAAYVNQGAYAKAIPLQTLVVSLLQDPDDVLDLGVLELDSGDVEAARATYTDLLRRSTLDFMAEAKAWNYLALLRWGQGDLDGALEAFDRGLEADEDALDARENKAILLIHLGRKEEAAGLLRSVIRDSEDRDATRARYHLLRLRHPTLVEGR